MKNSVLMISLLFFSFDIYGGNNIAPPAKYMSPNALPLQVVYRFDDHRYIILTGKSVIMTALIIVQVNTGILIHKKYILPCWRYA
ncbi:hypothetical protein N6N71_13035 [Escherichia albertii]|uniref:hypothetical protein n=1 Tax=Escherichia albertii TaxID=208962 RepID=UPI0021D4216D|nr:hypothetical protein [Escherichia albertii]MCU7309525.1 hypothetical protein [Escherichia albertii]MCZ8811084.1 hypothetical protein [Escherichia albertii]